MSNDTTDRHALPVIAGVAAVALFPIAAVAWGSSEVFKSFIVPTALILGLVWLAGMPERSRAREREQRIAEDRHNASRQAENAELNRMRREVAEWKAQGKL